MSLEGGFHPGPFVRVSGGDTAAAAAAHVRPFSPSLPCFTLLPFPVLCAPFAAPPQFQDHHDNHIYILHSPSPPNQNTWDVSSPPPPPPPFQPTPPFFFFFKIYPCF